MPSTSSAYQYYARHYDAGQLHFSVLMYSYLRDVLRLHPPVAHTMIDLACGTGTLVLMLADDGWDVLGIDGSRAMLREAQRKARHIGSGQSIRLRRADMREWSVRDPVALVTCVYDSLNYLADDTELAATFGCVWAALQPGGLWIFDLNTPYFLEHVWQPVEIEEREGYAQIMHTTFDAEHCTSNMHLIGFVQCADGLYERFEEQHAEHGYTAATIANLLTDAGFSVEAQYECFLLSAPTPQTHRWLWVARKLGAR